jgi:hypothetical protein
MACPPTSCQSCMTCPTHLVSGCMAMTEGSAEGWRGAAVVFACIAWAHVRAVRGWWGKCLLDD